MQGLFIHSNLQTIILDKIKYLSLNVIDWDIKYIVFDLEIPARLLCMILNCHQIPRVKCNGRLS